MGCQQSQLLKEGQIVNSGYDLDTKKGFKKKNAYEKINGRCLNDQIYENIKRIDYVKNPADIEFIEKAIAKHFLLFKLSKQERRELANAMECYETPIGDYIFKQGTPASMFFIIREGQVQIQIDNAPVKTMTKSDFFGQLALIYSSPRSASVKVTSACTLWCLSQHVFLKIQREMVKHNYKIAKPFVDKLPLFSFLTPKQRDAISYNMNTLKYAENEAIFKAGDYAVSFFAIISGLVQISIPEKPSIRYQAGDSFGQGCLKQNEKRSGTAICVQRTQLLAISREDLKSCLGDKSLQELFFLNILKWSFRRSQFFKSMPNFDQAKLVKCGKIVSKDDGEVMVDVGETEENIYICLQGKISEYAVGAIVNEQEALDEAVQSFVSKKKLLKKGTGCIFEIPIRVIQRQRKIKIRNLGTLKKFQNQGGTKTEINAPVEIKDLYVLCRLGEGQMGRVYLVQNKKTRKKYALKCVQKNLVLKHHMQKFMKCQREILQFIECPFIVKLYQTYKDSHFLYLLLNYIEGGDFFDVLSDLQVCNTAAAQFFFGCLYLGVEYLHKNQIVYRDLKPQNAAVDRQGYLHIIDMGTAKMLKDDDESGFRTFTIIGTPHYMAPEVLEAKGYSFEVDVWSLGVILFQMLCGALPYGFEADDPVSIYKQIQKNDLKFPKFFSDPAGKELIARLLQKNPQKRSIQNYNQIKNADFFKNFSWRQLQTQKMVAPALPKIPDQKYNKSQYLLSYLQREKMKMEKPMEPKHKNWDELF